jgi:diguanylate cyclase (GGDEF)-like protein/PAS domain S-box-containing protein
MVSILKYYRVLIILPLIVWAVAFMMPSDGLWIQIPLHASLEAAGALIAMVVVATFVVFRADPYLSRLPLAIPLALLSMGILDGLHGLLQPGNGFVLLHSLATFVGGLLFMSILTPFGRQSATGKPLIIVVAALPVTLLGLWALSGYSTPAMLDASGQFTLAARFLNITGGLAFVLAAIQLNRLYIASTERNHQLFAIHCVLFGSSGLLYEQSVIWDASWWWWHFIRLAAYGIALGVMLIRSLDSMRKIEHADRLMRGISDNATTVIYAKDRDGRYTLINQRFEELHQTRRERVLGQADWALFDKSTAQQKISNDERVMREGKAIEFEESAYLDDEIHTYIALKFPLIDSAGQVYGLGSIATDITERKKTEKTLTELAHLDLLTGLDNRKLFHDKLQLAINTAGRHKYLLALLFIDFDRFKFVNDSLGHPVGDKLLIAAANRLRTLVRGEDSLARLGGDEFTCLLPNIDHRKDAAIVAEKIVESLSRPFKVSGNEITLTVSIGVGLYPDDAQDIDSLIKHADAAMYRAKDNGKNRYEFYSTEISRIVNDKFRLEGDLRRALANNELELYWQPQVELRDERVVGAECLIRWRHPQRGMIMPDQFIELAEESNLILAIGNRVLQQAIQQGGAWYRIGRPIRIAVNISARQLDDDSLAATILSFLDEFGLPPEYLEIELTESGLMDSRKKGAERLNQLISAGVTLSIDDFGTGYSSLSRLKSLPLHRVKIDRSFIMDIPDDPNDVAITRSIIAMTRSLDLEIVAEGVETNFQADFLRSENCHIAQGYLYSSPLPLEEFERRYIAL